MSNTITGLTVPPATPSLEAGSGVAAESSFAETLRNVIAQVNQLQEQANQKIADLLTGSGEDLHTTLIAVEKASLAFQMMVEVRNKIVQAYHEIAQMQF